MGKVCEAEGLVLHLYLESTGLLNLVEPDDEVQIFNQFLWHILVFLSCRSDAFMGRI